MIVGELKAIIANLDDNMKVGGSGHFGEFLECWRISVTSVKEKMFSNKSEDILCISIESAGEDPE